MNYSAFGLIFESEIPLPELLPTNKPADISVRLGSVPQQLTTATDEGVRYQSNTHEFLMIMDGVARYWVRAGEEIIVQANAEASEESIRLYLLGSVMGALLLMRGLLPLHASAACKSGQAIVFAGKSGAGKSTTAQALLNNGWQLMADDITVLKRDENGSVMVVPGFPRAKLWADALKKLGHSKDGLKRVDVDMEKYYLQSSDAFQRQEVECSAVYLLSPTLAHEKIEISDITGVEKLRNLKAQTFRKRFLKGLEQHRNLNPVYFSVAKQLPMYRLYRPERENTTTEIARLISARHGAVV